MTHKGCVILVQITHTTVQGDYVEESPQARAFADGLKLALRELAHDEPETLRAFLMAVFQHLNEGASQWAGGKILAFVAAALFGAGVWLLAKVKL
jgi:hypothetical protein